jgi:hypothetical protein
MSENHGSVNSPQEKKLKLMAVHRFNNMGMADIDETADFTESLKIREVEYDEKGHIIKENEYSEDGELGEELIRKYNEKGNVIEIEHYFEGMLSETTFYEYNEDGLVLTERLKYADGGELISTYTYDEHKNVIEKRTVDNDGALDSYETAKFDVKRPLEHLKYDSENNLIESRRFIYRADNPEILQEEILFDGSAGTELRTVYLDNEAGTVTYNKKGEIHTRQAFVYDEKKRVSETIINAFSGSYHYKYIYDERDNVIDESRTQSNTLFFKALSEYDENGRLTARSVTEMNSGLFTDIYRYEFYS